MGVVGNERGAGAVAGDAPVVGWVHGEVVRLESGRHIVGRGIVDDELDEFGSIALQLAAVGIQERDANWVVGKDGTVVHDVDT
jgi:hypothetical protein